MIIFNGTIKSETPISIVLPNDLKKENYTASMPIVNNEGIKEYTCIIPSSSFRGLMRRTYASMIADGKPQTVEQLYLNRAGQERSDTLSKNKCGKVDIIELEKFRKENPVVDMFGAGLQLASKLKVGNAVPKVRISHQEIFYVRKDPIDDNETYLSLSDKEKIKAEKREMAMNYLRELRRNKADKKEIKEAEENPDLLCLENSTAHLGSFYAMPQGTIMQHKMTLEDNSLLNAVIDILRLISLKPIVGGHSAHGCGEFSAQWDITRVDKSVEKIGSISIGGFKLAEME